MQFLLRGEKSSYWIAKLAKSDGFSQYYLMVWFLTFAPCERRSQP